MSLKRLGPKKLHLECGQLDKADAKIFSRSVFYELVEVYCGFEANREGWGLAAFQVA
ncbi:MAG: hypothetical protein U0V70_17810 [Terriglobia bacterium]